MHLISALAPIKSGGTQWRHERAVSFIHDLMTLLGEEIFVARGATDHHQLPWKLHFLQGNFFLRRRTIYEHRFWSVTRRDGIAVSVECAKMEKMESQEEEEERQFEPQIMRRVSVSKCYISRVVASSNHNQFFNQRQIYRHDKRSKRHKYMSLSMKQIVVKQGGRLRDRLQYKIIF